MCRQEEDFFKAFLDAHMKKKKKKKENASCIAQRKLHAAEPVVDGSYLIKEQLLGSKDRWRTEGILERVPFNPPPRLSTSYMKTRKDL